MAHVIHVMSCVPPILSFDDVANVLMWLSAFYSHTKTLRTPAGRGTAIEASSAAAAAFTLRVQRTAMNGDRSTCEVCRPTETEEPVGCRTIHTNVHVCTPRINGGVDYVYCFGGTGLSEHSQFVLEVWLWRRSYIITTTNTNNKKATAA